MGIAENKGDALTFWVLTGRRTVIARSVIRSAFNPLEPNKRQGFNINIPHDIEGSSEPSLENPTIQSTDKTPTIDLLLASEVTKSKGMPTFKPDEAMGVVFIHDNSRGVPTRSTISNDDGANEWIISEIQDHRIEDGRLELKVLWENGDQSWEPILVIRKEETDKISKIC